MASAKYSPSAMHRNHTGSPSSLMISLQRYTLVATVLLLMTHAPPGVSAFNTFVEQHLAMEPQDQIAVVGARVTLPCRVVNKQGVLQWTRDGFGLGTRRSLSGFERYSMIGSDEEGDYSLQVYPVELEDDAVFQCQVSASGHDHPGVRSRSATLTVLVPPDDPTITQGEVYAATEDRELQLECVSPNGKPAAEITWIDGFGNVLTDGVSHTVEQAADMRRFTVRSVLRMTPGKEHHNRSVMCQAQNTVDKNYRTATIRLEVQYAPKVVVSIVNGAMETGQIPDGNNIEVLCAVDSNPDAVTYRWYLNEDQLPEQTSKILTMLNVTRDYQSMILKCVAQNEIGISSDSETFDIIYQPTFSRRPENAEAESQEEVTLHCEVDANPVPEIVWVFDPSDRANQNPRVVGTATSLTVVASTETAGRYFCKAMSPGFPEIRAEALVLLKGPPRIISANEQFSASGSTVSEEDAFDIECTAHSVPKANHVSWAFDGKLIDFSNDLTFTMRESYVPNGIRSTLRVEENYRDFLGRYSCIVINAYGSDSLDIVFRESKNLSLVILVAGSTLLLLILVVGVSAIVYCMRRSTAKKVLPPADLIPKESVMTLKGHSSHHANNKKNAAKCKAPPSTSMVAMATAGDISIGVTDLQSGGYGSATGLPEYQESNSGSYSTTTTISINKNDLLAGRGGGCGHQMQQQQGLAMPAHSRYSGAFGDNLSIHTNQSSIINGIGPSYVDYARDFYSPSLQNANNCLLQIQRETPTYV